MVMGPGRPGLWMVPIMVAAVLTPICDVATAAWWLAKPRSEVWELTESTSLATVAVIVALGSEGRVNPFNSHHDTCRRSQPRRLNDYGMTH